MHRSHFHFHSWGVVAENKPRTTTKVQVHPVELLNLMDGELSTETTTLKNGGLKEDGSTYVVQVDMGATIECEWLGETNRITSPDVRRGEQVMIYRTERDHRYYWTSIGRDEDLRRLETVIWRISAFPENPDEPVTVDNSYFMEMSSHDTHITIQTAERNGELCTYTVQHHGGEGVSTWKDNIGNIIQIDSAKTDILIENAALAKVELDKPNIAVEAPGWIQIIGIDRVLVKSFTRLILKGPTRIIIL